jgi:hypothetical protein
MKTDQHEIDQDENKSSAANCLLKKQPSPVPCNVVVVKKMPQLHRAFVSIVVISSLAFLGCREKTPDNQTVESALAPNSETGSLEPIFSPENIDDLLGQLDKLVGKQDYKTARELLAKCDRDLLSRNFTEAVKSGKATPFLLGVAGFDIAVPGVDVQFGHLKLRNGQVNEMPGCSDAMIGGVEQDRYQSLCLSFAAEFNRNVLKITDLR